MSIKKLLLKVSVSLALFVILFANIDITSVLANFNSVDFRYIPVILGLIILNYIVSSIRWKKLLFDKCNLFYLTCLYFTGSFFNNFMPTSIGGDVYKIVKLGKKINDKPFAFAATFTERFLGVVALGAISLLGALKLYPLYTVVSIVSLLVIAAISLRILHFLATKIKIVETLLSAFSRYKDHRADLYFALFFSFGVQFLAILTQYFVFVALGYTPSLIYALFVLPIITLAGFFIPSLNGIGVQDALYVSMFAVVGIPASAAITASILYHIFRLVVSLIGGILYAFGFDD